MNKKITLSIGIPAHNEEANIQQLLASINNQRQEHFVLENIFIVCDGCTDRTVELAQEFAKKHNLSSVKILDDGKRMGKAQRLNQIYDINTSETLLTMDADVIFKGKEDLDALAKAMTENPELLVVGPRYEPVKTNTLMGKFAEYSYLFFEEAILKKNNGNNIYALMGCCSLIKKSMTDSFRFPLSVISDQNYLFLKARSRGTHTFQLIKSAVVLFGTVSTFEDWRILSSRSVIGDRQSVREHFGEDIFQKEYFMPHKYLYSALVKWLLKNPFYTVGALFMNLYIRAFPYTAKPIKNGVWETTSSSKIAIHI